MDRLFKNRTARRPLIDITDKELEQTLIKLGMPADQCFTAYKTTMPQQYLMLRNLALGVYADYVAAQRGDKLAKEAIEYCREMWHEMSLRA